MAQPGMTTAVIRADRVREGDFLPGLDNGYVYEDVSENTTPNFDGRFVTARSDGMVSIGFHTAEGEEGELIVPGNMPVTVETSNLDGRDADDAEV